MATHFITGDVGGGKSYYGTELALQCLKEGGWVHTNLPLKLDEFAKETDANGDPLSDRIIMLPKDPQKWVRVENLEDGDKRYYSDLLRMGEEGAENMVIIDEAAVWFHKDERNDARQKEMVGALKGLAALCRHGGLDLYFLSQRRSSVNKDLRDLANTRVHCTNVKNIPVWGPLLRPFMGDFRRWIYEGESSEPNGKMSVRFDPNVARFYETHAMRSNLVMPKGAGRVKKANAFNQRGAIMILGGFALCIGGLWYGVAGTADLLNRSESKDEEKTVSGLQEVQAISGDKIETKKVLVRPPAPKGGLVEIEWDPYDEHIICGLRRTRLAVSVHVRGGRVLRVGESYEGQRIASQFNVGNWWYFVTETNRVIVARPLRPEEREALPPVTIQGGEKQEKAPFVMDDKNPVEAITDKLNPL